MPSFYRCVFLLISLAAALSSGGCERRLTSPMLAPDAGSPLTRAPSDAISAEGAAARDRFAATLGRQDAGRPVLSLAIDGLELVTEQRIRVARGCIKPGWLLPSLAPRGGLDCPPYVPASIDGGFVGVKLFARRKAWALLINNGDLITHVNGIRVHSQDGLAEASALVTPEDSPAKILLQLYRAGRPLAITIVVEDVESKCRAF